MPAGFSGVDLEISDRESLADVEGFSAIGGFEFGDESSGAGGFFEGGEVGNVVGMGVGEEDKLDAQVFVCCQFEHA